MRAWLALALLLVARALHAQTPDPLGPAGYMPLDVGNEWEYRVHYVRPASPERAVDASFTAFVRIGVVGEALDGTHVRAVRDRLTDAGIVTQRDTLTVRYDEATGSVLEVGPDGVPSPLLFFLTDFHLPYGPTHSDGFFFGTDSTEVRTELGSFQGKRLFNWLWGFTVVHGLGVVEGGGGCHPCSAFSDEERWTLMYARIDRTEYGAHAVSAEREAATALSLRAYPNPARTSSPRARAMSSRWSRSEGAVSAPSPFARASRRASPSTAFRPARSSSAAAARQPSSRSSPTDGGLARASALEEALRVTLRLTPNAIEGATAERRRVDRAMPGQPLQGERILGCRDLVALGQATVASLHATTPPGTARRHGECDGPVNLSLSLPPSEERGHPLDGIHRIEPA